MSTPEERGLIDAMEILRDNHGAAIKHLDATRKSILSQKKTLEQSEETLVFWEAKEKVFRRALEAAQQLQLFEELKEGNLE